MNILVTGRNGQLGSELRELSQNSEHHFTFVDAQTGDITKKNQIEDLVVSNNIEGIVNCAAYTAVDLAEDEPEKAFAVNDLGVKNLVELAEKFNLRLIHFSTDYVFNGNGDRPYQPADTTDPIGVYGASKRNGEMHVLNSSSDSIVIRTSWVYSGYGKNFVKTMLRLGSERDQISVVNDQFGSPTYACDLAEASLKIIEKTSSISEKGKLYHYSNSGNISWFEFATKIFELSTKTECKVVPISSAQYPTKAKRPHYSVLDCSAIESAFGLKINDWQSALARCMQKIESN